MIRALVIGLIGGIGSGKSRVAAEFVGRGAAMISGDNLGHEALRQPALRAQVLERFGADMAGADGEIDRRKLAAIVFTDPAQLRALEKILFPWIKRGMEEQIAAAQRDRAVRLVVVDAAIMMEAGWNKACDKIVYVHAPREQRVSRLAQQRGWTPKEMDARSAAQWPLTDKVSKADVAIDNSGTPDALAGQVDELLKQWVFPVAFQEGFGDNT